MGVEVCIVEFISLISLLLGITIIVQSAMFTHILVNFFPELSIKYIMAANIFAGIIIVLLAVAGMIIQCIKRQGWYTMTITGISFIGILFIGAAFVFVSMVKTHFLQSITICIKGYFSNYSSNDGYRHIVDSIQQSFHCCGSTGTSSYGTAIPSSCCFDGGDCTLFSHALFEDGCTYKFVSSLKSYFSSMNEMILYASLILLITNFYACYCYFNKNDKYSHQNLTQKFNLTTYEATRTDRVLPGYVNTMK